MRKLFVIIVSVALLIAFTSCDSLIGPEEPGRSGPCCVGDIALSGMYEIWIAVSGGYRFVADAIEVNVDIYDDSVVITFVWEGTSFHFDKTVTADVIISDATGKSGSSWDLIT